MAERRSFLLRVDPDLLDAVQRWANDDLRSLNGQIEFLLRRALRDADRVGKRDEGQQATSEGQSG
ncbi:MAG TPA: DNA-binding protein [Gemmatimonadaceae bacterium]